MLFPGIHELGIIGILAEWFFIAVFLGLVFGGVIRIFRMFF